MNILKCKYQEQDASMTLEQGIEEYYQANPQLLFPSTLDTGSAEFFKCHDRIHVVFGCNTSALHEVRTDLWTFLGSDVGALKYASYLKHPALKSLMKDMKEKASQDPNYLKQLREDFKKSFSSIAIAPFQVMSRARKMKKKWPWLGSEELLNRPLNEIRNEYGIKIF